MSKQEVLEALRTAILDGEDTRAVEIARQVSGDTDALIEAVDVAVATIKDVGDRFGAGECYLPEMVLAAETMLAFMQVASPALEKATGKARKTGKVVLATVKGDIHSIGKDIVATMLNAAGFEVVDLGVDVSPMDAIKTAEQTGAQFIGLSALMTTSMPYQKETVALLTELKSRKKFFVIVGGGPVTSEYAQGIGADGWAADAAAAVKVCEDLLACGELPSEAKFTFQEKVQ